MAIEKMNRVELDGRQFTVDAARSKEEWVAADAVSTARTAVPARFRPAARAVIDHFSGVSQ